MPVAVGVVERIWRYPIKSTGGESLGQADIESRGLAGDRLYAVRDVDGKLGSGKNTRRFRRMDGLLRLRSRYVAGTTIPQLLGPDGDVVANPATYLRQHLGRDHVEVAREDQISHFDALPLHLLSTATLRWVGEALPGVPVDERRFRPNLLIRTPPGARPFAEDDWIGRVARIGPHVLVEFARAPLRCVMTNMRQQDLPHSSDVLRLIARSHGNRLGVLASVVQPGSVRIGDGVVMV